MLELNFSVPRYTAVMECVPATRVEMEIEAFPFTILALPSAVELSKNITVPVGVPDSEVTAALNLTSCPKNEGLGVEAKVVVVGVVPTCSSTPTSPGPQSVTGHIVAATSGRPSPFRSPTASPMGVDPPES